jgi:TRAP-type mannitol/chloroaromatic compound transport system permease small subunit
VIAILRRIEAACAWFGRIAAWTVPLLVAGVCLGVLMAHLRLNELARWGVDLPVFADRLTLNGLTDLQWHLFAAMVMLGGAYTLHENRHVSVDFIAGRLSARLRTWITVVCDLVMLLPFALVMTWFSWKYTMTAYASGEGSSYGGLVDLWIVKSVMTLGFGLLALLALARPLRLTIEMLSANERADDRKQR